MQSNLGLDEWLIANVTAADTGVIQYAKDYSDGPLKTNVLSHEIKFDVTNTGNVTPGWKLTRVSVNQSGTFLTASRDRTHDLTITLGPITPVVVGQKTVRMKDGTTAQVPIFGSTPSYQAADAHLASQIGAAVAAAVKSALTP